MMAETLIHVDKHEQVAMARLTRGTTNAINLTLVQEMTAVLREVKADTAIHSLILTSSNEKFFSIGFDIPHLIECSQEKLGAFYHAFNQMCLELFILPKPTLAVINGHAIAGGCILTLCCDYRFMAQGRKLMGLNEIKLGLPVPYVADCILRNLVGIRYAREIMDTGDFYPPQTSLQMGLVDHVLPIEELGASVMEKALALGSSPQQAYALIKRNRTETIERQIRTRLEEKEQRFIESWFSAEAQVLLREAMGKF
jgi:enoyl-CoA hydratase/carnithine racemase